MIVSSNRLRLVRWLAHGKFQQTRSSFITRLSGRSSHTGSRTDGSIYCWGVELDRTPTTEGVGSIEISVSYPLFGRGLECNLLIYLSRKRVNAHKIHPYYDKLSILYFAHDAECSPPTLTSFLFAKRHTGEGGGHRDLFIFRCSEMAPSAMNRLPDDVNTSQGILIHTSYSSP